MRNDGLFQWYDLVSSFRSYLWSLQLLTARIVFLTLYIAFFSVVPLAKVMTKGAKLARGPKPSSASTCLRLQECFPYSPYCLSTVVFGPIPPQVVPYGRIEV